MAHTGGCPATHKWQMLVPNICGGGEHRIDGKWDLIVAHPPCTRLCNSGQRWLYWGDDEYKSKKIAERRTDTRDLESPFRR